MMTLGIPGSPTTAVLLAGMVIWGSSPDRSCSRRSLISSGR